MREMLYIRWPLALPSVLSCHHLAQTIARKRRASRRRFWKLTFGASRKWKGNAKRTPNFYWVYTVATCTIVCNLCEIIRFTTKGFFSEQRLAL